MNMLYVEVMYHFNEQVDFKISSKLIQASKGSMTSLIYCPAKWRLPAAHMGKMKPFKFLRLNTP